jgi:hypothetical protein
MDWTNWVQFPAKALLYFLCRHIRKAVGTGVTLVGTNVYFTLRQGGQSVKLTAHLYPRSAKNSSELQISACLHIQ